MSNYVKEVREVLKIKSGCDGPLLDLYTLLVFVKGKNVTWKDVHDAWAIWRNRTAPEHKSLVPYETLSPDVQKLDEEYANAIAETYEAFNAMTINKEARG